jgi:hypothetical protein
MDRLVRKFIDVGIPECFLHDGNSIIQLPIIEFLAGLDWNVEKGDEFAEQCKTIWMNRDDLMRPEFSENDA